MLNVRVGDFTDDCITDVRSYFCFYKQESWFADPFVRKVIEVVDDFEVIDGGLLESSHRGYVSSDQLSTGAMAVILMKMVPQCIVYATRCGDHCWLLIRELAILQDVTILLHHCPFNVCTPAVFVESGKEVKSRDEFIKEYSRLRNYTS